MAKEAALYTSKSPLEKIQHVLDIKQRQRNLRIKEQLTNKVKLSDAQKERIMHCIRWQYLSRESLIKLSADPDFHLAKGLIVQALAVMLGGNEAIEDKELQLTLKPRHCSFMYQSFAEEGASLDADPETGDEH